MPTSSVRGKVLFLAIVCAFALLAARLTQIQLLEHAAFAQDAVGQHFRHVEVPAARGRIYDRNLLLLATTVPSPSIFVNPSEVPNLRYLAGVLGDTLSVDPRALYDSFCARADRQFVWVKRRIRPEQHQAFLALTATQRTGAYVRWEPKRKYPLGRLACHVLGLVDVDGEGRLGVENVFQQDLAGRSGHETLAADGKGALRVVRQEYDEPPVAGLSLVLTVDTSVQEIVEEEIARGYEERRPESVTAVVMRTETGEILALANLPSFDPNDPASDPPSHLMNLAVGARYEPGSTFKPLILAAALEENIVSLDDRLFCYNGIYRTGKRILHDHHPYGWLTMAEVVIKSSNIGIARIGEMLGARRLQQYLDIYDIVGRTGIELTGEVAGRVTPAERWSYYTTTSVPMGHEVAVTPLRLLVAMNALANGGVLVEPRIVKAVVDDKLRIVRRMPDTPRRRVISRRTAGLMLHDVLTGVVEEGTGQRAKLARWTVAGKTGTAQKVLEDGTYSHSRYVASFVCVAPAERPVVSILVMFDGATEGTSFYGGSVAAPVAAGITRRVLECLDVEPSDRAIGSHLAYADDWGAQR